MTPQELESAGERLFGENWKGLIADALGIDASTRWRMFQKDKVPGPVAAAVNSWLTLHGAFRILPPLKPLGPYRSEGALALGLVTEDYRLNVPLIAEAIFGEHWKTALSARLGISHSTLWRQMEADEYPTQVVAALRAWQLLSVLTGAIPALSSTEEPIEAPAPAKKRKQSKYARLMD